LRPPAGATIDTTLSVLMLAVMRGSLVGREDVDERRVDDIARDCFCLTVSCADKNRRVLVCSGCIARRDADDSSCACVERKLMKKCFLVAVSKRESGKLAEVVLWSAK
jgi:hypothetical protein